MREFRSRVKAALRRSRMLGETPEEESIERGELKIDFGRRLVTLRDEEAKLTYVEFEILGALARSPGRVLTRETLLEHVWGDSEYRDPRTVDVHIRHLREKLESDPKQPEFLFTVRGVGYRFKEQARRAPAATHQHRQPDPGHLDLDRGRDDAADLHLHRRDRR